MSLGECGEMRVGFDARWYNDSGVGVHVAELLSALIVADRRDFDLFVYEDPRNPAPNIEGRSVTRIAVSAPKYSLSEQFLLRRRAQEDQLDVFHSPFYDAPLFLACPLLITIHDLIPFFFQLHRWPKQSLIKLAHRAVAKRSRHIIAVSQTTALDLQKTLGVPPERITVVHNAAAKHYSAAELDGDELGYLRRKYGVTEPYVVVASARNWRTKNLATGLKALQIAARRSQIEFQTVVYGPPQGIDALGPEGLWADLRLHRTGYLESPDLARLFRHACAFLMPSLYEGFGIPVVEAMSCGCPVLCSSSGALAEVAGSGAQTFAASDAAGMGDAVAGLLANPEERRRWKIAALRRAADFSWSRAAEETISVYYRAYEQALSVSSS